MTRAPGRKIYYISYDTGVDSEKREKRIDVRILFPTWKYAYTQLVPVEIYG